MDRNTSNRSRSILASMQVCDVSKLQVPKALLESEEVQVFEGEWDAEGVWVYQAFRDEIADWALEHQNFGGPAWNPTRMTWVKPSFAWVLYRSGYAGKPGQTRVLKVKISHDTLAELLSRCQCKEGGGGSKGRVQWDPARDLLSGEGREPRRLLRKRAIQIGLSRELSELYVEKALRIVDVTDLSRRVGAAHASGKKGDIDALKPLLPPERPYLPALPDVALQSLGMLPGDTAVWLGQIGRGKATGGSSSKGKRK
eukprot:Cvel_98.t2-p1 / transcript=Cvel_98.t2 / gene=Cvel_98 / organism=Chromera_velia_CCMP2878 / gene_product=hypothetical protein / transcript_product=hypothetical protein / location=Cvel_scaffold8:58216-58977(-) / protein_length=254 / sequence_SO=supercontig / SO=protein_coding / is_pseudo=false